MNASLTTRLRQSGGSVVMSVPKAVLDLLGLKVGSTLALEVDHGRLMVSAADNDFSTIKETPELLARIAEVHASTAETIAYSSRVLSGLRRDDEQDERERDAAVRRAAAAAVDPSKSRAVLDYLGIPVQEDAPADGRLARAPAGAKGTER